MDEDKKEDVKVDAPVEPVLDEDGNPVAPEADSEEKDEGKSEEAKKEGV